MSVGAQESDKMPKHYTIATINCRVSSEAPDEDEAEIIARKRLSELMNMDMGDIQFAGYEIERENGYC